jgi:hypothetical protein
MRLERILRHLECLFSAFAAGDRFWNIREGHEAAITIGFQI